MLEIVDKVSSSVKDVIGKTMEGIGETQKNRVQVLVNKEHAGAIKKTGAHELGHALGLKHAKTAKNSPDPTGPKSLPSDNLMLQSSDSDGTNVTNDQRRQTVNEIETDTKLNPVFLEQKTINKIE